MRMLASVLFITFITLITMGGTAFAADREHLVKITFKYRGEDIVASLDNTPTSREFLAMLPLTVKLEDYGSIEKIAYLPKKLSEGEMSTTITPKVGDFTYYAPWGNLAIFHENFRSSPGLIKLGFIEKGLETIGKKGTETVTIVRVNPD